MFLSGRVAYMRPAIHVEAQFSLIELESRLRANSTSLWNLVVNSRQVDVDRIAGELSVELSEPTDEVTARMELGIINNWLYTIREFRSYCFRERPVLWNSTKETMELLEDKLLQVQDDANALLRELSKPDPVFYTHFSVD